MLEGILVGQETYRSACIKSDILVSNSKGFHGLRDSVGSRASIEETGVPAIPSTEDSPDECDDFARAQASSKGLSSSMLIGNSHNGRSIGSSNSRFSKEPPSLGGFAVVLFCCKSPSRLASQDKKV